MLYLSTFLGGKLSKPRAYTHLCHLVNEETEAQESYVTGSSSIPFKCSLCQQSIEFSVVHPKTNGSD